MKSTWTFGKYKIGIMRANAHAAQVTAGRIEVCRECGVVIQANERRLTFSIKATAGDLSARIRAFTLSRVH